MGDSTTGPTKVLDEGDHQRYRVLVETSPDCIHEIDLEGLVLSMNPAGLGMLGLERAEQVCGTPFLEVASEAERPRLWSLFERAREGDPSEFQFLTRHGRYFASSFYPVRGEDGGVVRIMGLTRDVTDQVETERALRKSEERYRKIFQDAPVALWEEDFTGVKAALDELAATGVTDLPAYIDEHPEFVRLCLSRLRVLAVNPAGLKMFGLENTPDIDAVLPAVFTDESFDVFRRELIGIVRGQDYFEALTPVRTLSGEPLEMILTMRLPSLPHDFESVTVSLLDITERSRARDEVLTIRRRYRALAEHAPVGVFHTDAAGACDWINPKLSELLGLPTDAAMGEGWAAAVHPEDRARVHGGWSAAVAGEGEYSEQLRFRHEDGTVRWVSVDAVPEHGPEGEVVGYVGTLVDTTDLREAERAFRRSEAEHEALFRRASHGIYRSDLTGRFLTANPAMATMLGYDSPEELKGINSRSLYADLEVRETLVERHRLAGPFDEEVDWLKKDGEPIRVRLRGHALSIDEDDTAEIFEVFAEDVTQERRLEEGLRQAQKMQAVGQLTGGIAHDFNNILTAIMSTAQLLEADARTPDEKGLAADIVAAAARGADLVSKLLAFSRSQNISPAPVDLSFLVRESADFLRRTIPAGIALELGPALDPCFAHADEGAVHQILLNLVNNARDAIGGTGTIRLQVGPAELDEADVVARGWGRPGRYVALSVQDDGTGMDEAVVARVFEPFFTTKDRGQGTGLGMSMIYGLAKQHEGFVDVHSVKGVGTTVRVLFPPAAPTGPTA